MSLLYKKVGRRYVPVSMYGPEVADAFPQGAHLIVVSNGWTSCRYNVTPEHAPLLAALRLHREACMDAMRKASASRPTKRPLTAKEAKAYRAYCDVMGAESMLQLETASASDMVDALEKSLIDKVYPTSQSEKAGFPLDKNGLELPKISESAGRGFRHYFRSARITAWQAASCSATRSASAWRVAVASRNGPRNALVAAASRSQALAAVSPAPGTLAGMGSRRAPARRSAMTASFFRSASVLLLSRVSAIVA